MRIEVHVFHHLVPDPNAGEILQRVLMAVTNLEGKIDTMSERLEREVQETRDAVSALTGRYQAKIDTLTTQTVDMQTQIDALKAALANGDTPAANAAADELDALQTQMAALAAEPVVEPAPEPSAEG